MIPKFAYRALAPSLLVLILVACNNKKELQREAQEFIDHYAQDFVHLYYESSKAEWASNTIIVEGDTTQSHRTNLANEAMASYAGSEEIIREAQELLDDKSKLTELQGRQLEAILYAAAVSPQTIKDTVNMRIAAETEQTQKLFGFKYTLNGQAISTNEIDEMLVSETNLARRKAVWAASKQVGPSLKPGLVELRRLRNTVVQALGYEDYFSYQVSEYGMTTEEMMQLCEQMIDDLWPLYREIHTYMRYTLAEKYDTAVPEYLPAHWLPNRWAQDWSEGMEVKGFDINKALKEHPAHWIIEEAEDFYVSLGFPKLPSVFWEKSNLYPYPADSSVSKNNHASAWHMNLKDDVRSLMSVESNSRWFETVNHELGHIYYYMAYSTENVPILLRSGANRAFHEAIGTMMGMAAMQKPFLVERGLISPDAETDQTQLLLKEALNAVVFIPFSAGTMTHFERDMYHKNAASDTWNKSWWDYVKKFQGVVPPAPRDESYCDAATKTHINNDAAQYYDYALSYAILYQLHQHIASKILKQDPHATNYYGNRAVGDFLHSILEVGATQDWNTLLKKATGEGLNARAMVAYFEPLMKYLQKENKGREYTLRENP